MIKKFASLIATMIVAQLKVKYELYETSRDRVNHIGSDLFISTPAVGEVYVIRKGNEAKAYRVVYISHYQNGKGGYIYVKKMGNVEIPKN